METILRLTKKSAKRVFKNLRKKAPFHCSSLNKEIVITKLFLEHIAFNATKNRTHKEIIERLLIIPFLEEIFLKGTMREVRDKKENLFFRISRQFGEDIFVAIIIKSAKGYLLLSCFREY